MAINSFKTILNIKCIMTVIFSYILSEGQWILYILEQEMICDRFLFILFIFFSPLD